MKKLAHVFLILALLGATGGHWAVMQTIAWTNMLAKNLQTESLREAVSDTFDGEHPCPLCKQISAGKKAEKKADLPFEIKKMEFVSVRSMFVFSAPQDFKLASHLLPTFDGLTHRPSVPPPRIAAA